MATVLFPSQASAAPEDYMACDGHRPPASGDQGLGGKAGLFGVSWSGGSTPFDGRGPEGVAACDRALADLAPEHGLRKVSLVRARAMHRLVGGDPEGALRDLDLAGPSDATDFVRAYALKVAGRRTEAAALAGEAWERRPYTVGGASAALMSLDSVDKDLLLTVRRGLARLDPVWIEGLVNDALEQRRFDEVVDLHPHLVPRVRLGSLNVTDPANAEIDVENRTASALFWARHDGEYAFALAAQGRADEAREAVKSARGRLAKATQPPSPQELAIKRGLLRSRWERMVSLLPEANARAAREGGAIIDRWADLAEQRIARGASVEPTQMFPVTEPVRPEVEKLLTNLPDAEVAERPAHGLKARTLDQPATVGGFDALARYGAGTLRTVHVDGPSSAASQVDELALLRAADLVRKTGKPGFIVVGRNASRTKLVITSKPSGAVSETEPDCFVILDVLPVDPAALPSQFQGAAWRVLGVDEVSARLGPIYAQVK